MAIQNNIAEGASQYGIAFNNAYYRIVTAAISRQRGTDPKFSVMIDLSAYATATPGDDTREVDFKRYNANLDDVQAASGDAFLDKCYSWVMAQDDMAEARRYNMALTINHQTNDISATSGSVTIDGASAGGGPMVHISTTTLSSAAANVEFSGLGTTYEYYKLFYRYKQPTSTSTQYLMWRGMISGSQVSSIYSYHNIINADSDSDYGNAYTGCLLQQVLGEKEVAGEVTFYGIGKSSSRIMAHSNGLHQNSQAPYTSFGLHVGYGQAQSGTWNGIAMVGFFENLPVGATFSLYGIKAS